MTRLEAAARAAMIWHEEQAKALSKQPTNGDREWRRLEHQEQRDLLAAALSALAASPAGETVEVAVWEYADGDIRLVRAGSPIDEDGFRALTRLGTVRFPLTPATVETER